MAKTNNLGDFLKDVADGIRTARGSTGSIAAQNFRTEIEKLKPANYIDPSQASKVYKHTITLTAVGVYQKNSSYTTGTIISTFVLYSTTLNSSIAGEYNTSNWNNLLNSLRACFNAVDARVYTINDVYTYKAISVQSSYSGSASYYTIGTDNGQLYFTNATTPPQEGASNQIGSYILWTGAYISGNGYAAMHDWYVLNNFNGGNVIVTDVVTEL